MRMIKLRQLLIIFLILLCGCAKPEIRNLATSGSSIVCFGDSITFGYGADPGEDYPSILAKLVKLPVINAGVDGDTTFEALERLEYDVLNKDPRLVIVEFCGNDFLKKIPRAETVRNLTLIIERIQAQGAMVALVDISAGFFLREYRQAFKKLAAEKKTIFIPGLLSRVITDPAMKSDFFHPNARGYQVIAKRIFEGILAYIQ